MAIKKVVLGGGCFWCLEAIFCQIKGVTGVVCGYMGGDENLSPTYELVCGGVTGYAEVIKISYNDKIIRLNKLLNFFFKVHNPTTLNQQGADIGTQYCSIAYYSDNEEKKIILNMIDKVKGNFIDKIVTKVDKLTKFYIAEDYHQHYFKNNPNQSYCQVVIAPKIQKFMLELEIKE